MRIKLKYRMKGCKNVEAMVFKNADQAHKALLQMDLQALAYIVPGKEAPTPEAREAAAKESRAEWHEFTVIPMATGKGW